jgi:hypothetical protein
LVFTSVFQGDRGSEGIAGTSGTPGMRVSLSYKEKQLFFVFDTEEHIAIKHIITKLHYFNNEDFFCYYGIKNLYQIMTNQHNIPIWQFL